LPTGSVTIKILTLKITYMKKIVKKLTLLCCIVFLFAGNGIAQSPPSWSAKPNITNITQRCKGYYEYLPQGYTDVANANTKYPLILTFHGSGENGSGSATDLLKLVGPSVGLPSIIQNNQFPQSFTANSTTYKFIVIAPQFTDDPGGPEIEIVLNWILAQPQYRVDLSRIYITGFSQGGGDCIRLLGEVSVATANRIAAAVPMCTSVDFYQSVMRDRVYQANAPLLLFHNVNDPTVPYSRSTSIINQLNALTPPHSPAPILITNPGVQGTHDAWSNATNPGITYSAIGTKNIYEWMLQYSRSSCPAVTNLTATAITTTSATLNWTAATGAVSYAVDYQLSGASVWTSAGTSITTTSVSISGLTAGSTYNYRVKSNCSGGASSSYVTNTFTTVSGTTPSLSIGIKTVYESDGAITFPVCLSAPSSLPVTVQYSIAGGTATAGTDYTGGTGTITIPAGQTCGNINLVILTDNVTESTEFAMFKISNPQNATIANEFGVLNIINVAAASLPSLSVGVYTVYENANAITIPVTLSAASSLPVTVQYNTAGGTATAGVDYTGGNGTITIPVGQTFGNINVQILTDNITEVTEFAMFKLSNPQNATIANEYAVLNIINGAPPPVTNKLITTQTEEQTNNAKSILIFPNPAKDLVRINIPYALQKAGSFNIEVYDVANRLVKKQLLFNSAQAELSLKNLAPGVYYIKTIIGKNVHTQKLIKQ
jgi:dienelactone hydrolase